MLLLTIYIGFCIIGVCVGSYTKKKGISMSWSSKIQTLMLMVLLFTMGARLGVNKEVVSKLGTIGLSSLVLTAFILVGSVLAVILTRKFLRINRKGEKI